MGIHGALQPSFDDLGTPLSDTVFCVLDLETTGGGAECSITEVGAVKVQGGRVLGEFQTLVRPPSRIPAMIQLLTGITDQMVATAPSLDGVLPALDEFMAGTVLVAHNARFDVGFLKRGYESVGIRWRSPHVVDTVALARQLLLRDEVRNCKLATLAAHFHASTEPNHRALSDARATVDVLHGLLERAGSLGVHTLEDLCDVMLRVSPERRAKRVWASEVPEAPGVYWFVHDGKDADHRPRSEVLYVGKSVNLRRRVASYFTAAEQRSRIEEMVRVATRVEHEVCATDLEAEVRELRMIASHSPRYNRRSRRQQAVAWLKLTREAFPRVAVARAVSDDGCDYWGPFSSARAARAAAEVVGEAFGLRGCTVRLSPHRPITACAAGQMGRCVAPCELGDGVPAYAALVESTRRAWLGDIRPALQSAQPKLMRLVQDERFEEAGELTARLRSLHDASARHHRVLSVARCPEILAAAPGRRGWDLHCIRYGRLAGAATAPTAAVRQSADQLRRDAETVLPPPAATPAGSVEEAERIASWLETPGLRVLDVDGEWSWPIGACLGEAELVAALTGSASGGAPAVADLPPEVGAGNHRPGRRRARSSIPAV